MHLDYRMSTGSSFPPSDIKGLGTLFGMNIFEIVTSVQDSSTEHETATHQVRMKIKPGGEKGHISLVISLAF